MTLLTVQGLAKRFGDVDVLVPQAQMATAEAGLKAAGWDFDAELSAYDDAIDSEVELDLPDDEQA